MFVDKTWTRTIIIIAASWSISGDAIEHLTGSTESSAEYLRKVMIELRDLNAPPVPVEERPISPFYFDVDDKNFLAGKRCSDEKRIPKSPVIHTTEKNVLPVAHDQAFAESASHNQYYQVPAIVPAPQKAIPAVAPDSTRIGVPGFYNHGLRQGGVVNLNALANVMRDNQFVPGLMNNPIELPPAQSMYTYYFYPIKSFINDMRQNVQPHLSPFLQPDVRPDNTKLIQESQKEVVNPLFTAFSGFIGMAVLFMIGMFLLPRLGDFSSRVSDDDDYLRLTNTICGAIDRHNCTHYPNIKDLDERAAIRKSIKITRPSSVVLLPSNSKRHKSVTKRRRKGQSDCKNLPCKKSRLGAPT